MPLSPRLSATNLLHYQPGVDAPVRLHRISLSNILARCETLSGPGRTGVYQLRRGAIYEKQRTARDRCEIDSTDWRGMWKPGGHIPVFVDYVSQASRFSLLCCDVNRGQIRPDCTSLWDESLCGMIEISSYSAYHNKRPCLMGFSLH